MRCVATGFAKSAVVASCASKLAVPVVALKGQFGAIVPSEAARHGTTVISVQESELSAFTNDAREGFREHVRGGRA